MFCVPERGLSPYVITDLKIPPFLLPCILEFIKHIYPTRDEVTGEWRKLHNEKLNDLYSSPNVAWVIKSRRMRWVGHVARVGEEERCRQGFVGET